MISISTSSPSTRAAVSSSEAQIDANAEVGGEDDRDLSGRRDGRSFSSGEKPVVPITMALPARRQTSRFFSVTEG